MIFRVRLLAYLMLYSALDTAKPEIVTTHDLPLTRPALQDEGMYILKTSRKVSNDMSEGTTETISNDTGRVSHTVHSAKDTVTSTANTVRDNGGTVRNTVDKVIDSEFTVNESSISNTANNNAHLVDQTTAFYDTSTNASGQKEKDVTGIIDRESYILARKVIMWGFTPTFAVVGFACNCITLHALRAMTSSGSSTSYLKALAVSDTAYNLLGVYLTIGVVLEDLGYESVRDFNVYAYTYHWVFLHRALNRISAGFTVLLSTERFLAVVFPFKVKQAFLTRRPVIVITVCVIAISALLLVPSFMFEGREVVDPVTGRSSVILMDSKAGRDQSAFFQGYLTFSYIIFSVIPICLIIFLNGGILIKLVLMQRKRAKMTSAARARDHQITRSLLLISLMFLVTSFPVLVLLFIGKINEDVSVKWNEQLLYKLMLDLYSALGNLNSATNFFILTLSSSAFRTSLLAVFRRSV